MLQSLHYLRVFTHMAMLRTQNSDAYDEYSQQSGTGGLFFPTHKVRWKTSIADPAILVGSVTDTSRLILLLVVGSVTDTSRLILLLVVGSVTDTSRLILLLLVGSVTDTSRLMILVGSVTDTSRLILVGSVTDTSQLLLVGSVTDTSGLLLVGSVTVFFLPEWQSQLDSHDMMGPWPDVM